MTYPGLDVLRGIAAIAIVGRHLGLFPTTKAASALLHFTDTGVAVFGTISGFLLASSLTDRPVGIGAFICKRAKRLLPMYFFWSLVYIVLTMVYDILFDGGTIGAKFTQWGFWRAAILTGNASNHLWFLIWLFYWSVLLRLVWPVVKRPYVALPLCLVSLWSAAFGAGDFNYYAMRLLAFLLLGIFMFSVQPFLRRVSIGVWLFCGGLACVGHFLLSTWNTKFLWDAFVVVSVLSLACGQSFSAGLIGWWLGHVSLGVYLIHPLFAVGCAFVAKRFFEAPYNLLLLFLDWSLVVLLSCVSVIVMKKFSRRFVWLEQIC